jgi:hypothetical protein
MNIFSTFRSIYFLFLSIWCYAILELHVKTPKSTFVWFICSKCTILSFFLSFISWIFRPLISLSLPNHPFPKLEELIKEIGGRWLAKLKISRPFTQFFSWCSPKSIEPLSNSCFKFALDSQFSSALGIINFFQTIPKNFSTFWKACSSWMVGFHERHCSPSTSSSLGRSTSWFPTSNG